MTHPYSIFVWHAPLGQKDEGYWDEKSQVDSQEYALYVANLIHTESKAVIKVARHGLTVANIPDEKTVQRVEQQIAERWPHRQLFTRPR